jgi:pimeloyl-ACP methyl ester carboxylesterase
VILEGAGHFVHQERPEEVNRLILEFLRAPG